MNTRKLFAGLALAAGLALPGAGHADGGVTFDIRIGPPPVPYVAVPPPRPHYAWAPGYWAWDGWRYVWVDGRWLDARPGYVWVPDRWEPRGHRWHHAHGHWARPRIHPHHRHHDHRHHRPHRGHRDHRR